MRLDSRSLFAILSVKCRPSRIDDSRSPVPGAVSALRARIALFPQELCHAGRGGRHDPPATDPPSAPRSLPNCRARCSAPAMLRVQNAKRGRSTRVAQCDFAPSASLFNRSIVLGPMPLIPRRSSQRVNDLLPVRAFAIRSASTGPMPGRRSSESVGAFDRNRRGFRR